MKTSLCHSSPHTEASLDDRGQPLSLCQIVPHKGMPALELLPYVKINE